MLRLLEDDNHLSVFRQPSLKANGNTVDRQGRLYTCEQAGRRVTRTEYDGANTVIADRYNGKLNAPNDVVVASNGSVWFTDPTYGLVDMMEQEKTNVFRVDGKSGEIKVVIDDFVPPNGILFSPDEKNLYIIDAPAAHIRVFDVELDTGRLTNDKVFADGFASDGMRCDVDGNVWCSVGYGNARENGVRCYAPDGTLLGKIHLPEVGHQSDIRRRVAEPLVHPRHQLGLCLQRQHAGRGSRLITEGPVTETRKLAAILVADVVGFMGEDETGTFSCGRIEAHFVELIVT